MSKSKIIISVVGLALVTGGVFLGLNKKNEVAQVEVKQEQGLEEDKVKEVSNESETEKETDDKDKKLDENKKEETKKVEKETKKASNTTSNNSSTSSSSSKRNSNDSRTSTSYTKRSSSSSKNNTKSSTNNSYKPSKKKPVSKSRPQKRPSKPKNTSGGVPGFSNDEIIHTGKSNSGERVEMEGDWDKQVGDM